VTGNSATKGGGIYNAGGTATLNNSPVTYNSADITGGGIYNVATLALHNSAVTNNTPNQVAP
jgi:hypothetical protein